MAKETISQTEGLCKEVANCIKDAYDRGYKQGFWDGKEEAANCDCRDNMEDEYNRGLNVVWELVRKLRHPSYGDTYSNDEKKDIFGYVSADSILTNLSASEAIEKIKAWEENDMKNCKWFRVENANGSEGYRCDNPKNPFGWCHHVCEHFEGKTNEIEIGDEVTTKDVKRKGIVIRIASVCSLNTGKIEQEYTIWTGATIYRAYEGDDIQKTGKYFLQISEIVKQLEGE